MIDYNTPTFYNDGYDDGGGDIRKVEHHLRQSLENISNIFDVRITVSFSHSCLFCALGNKKSSMSVMKNVMTHRAPDIYCCLQLDHTSGRSDKWRQNGDVGRQ